MRNRISKVTCATFISVASLALGGIACSQVPKAEPVDAPLAQNSAVASAPEGALSAEDQNAAPFPAGRHAALVRKVCTECHNAFPILDLRYTREEATRYYRTMVHSDDSTEDAQKIIEYLSTTLGR